jgi:cysteinyl-tRNA synthetase
MITLLLDSSSHHLSVALAKGDKVLSFVEEKAFQTQSEIMVGRINKLLAQEKLTSDDIKRIVVASGPGSFTGVRIAVTIAKVWAYAKEVPLYAVSSLSVYRHETKPTICVLDARRERSFAGVYAQNNAILPDKIMQNSEILALAEKEGYLISGETKHLGIEPAKFNRFENMLKSISEEFIPLRKGEVSMYVCGPTVYDYVHVGNMRPVVVFDTLRRFFNHAGYQVIYVSNYTDVDDRIIEKAQKTNKKETEISEFYIEAFADSATKINALKPTFTPKATQHIESMIAFIKVLIANGDAYENDGEVFFRVSKVETYGELSNVTQDELQVGARIDANPKKEHPNDFLLWKKTDDAGIKWDSPWGAGRPGWHTECVVMINDIFGKPLIDIHGGGFDLKFPHHENEIAQARAYANTGLANYWMHNGFINLNNQKMAKSTGNFVTAKDFIEEYGATSLRLLLLSTHYRSPVNLSAEIIENTNNESLQKALDKAKINLDVTYFRTIGLLDLN